MFGLSIITSPGNLPKGILEMYGRSNPIRIKIIPIVIKMKRKLKPESGIDLKDTNRSARSGTRTRTGTNAHRILSPVRLPIPPSELSKVQN